LGEGMDQGKFKVVHVHHFKTGSSISTRIVGKIFEMLQLSKLRNGEVITK
jgi:hypothetical protein